MEFNDTEYVNREILKVADRLAASNAAQERCYAGLREQVTTLIRHLRNAMHPNYFDDCERESKPCDRLGVCSLYNTFATLKSCLNRVMEDETECARIAFELISSLPEIKAVLDTDVHAAYEGDPAASSIGEIMLAYPAFEAISVFRIAHRLYQMKVPILPRMMTEYAHQTTGIDIHPGATIGRYFFIDHGTGVVIGETTTIGEHVKLYQGVTLGAKSFELDQDGNPVKGIKRHPDIGSHVVIYAGATILGGQTVIGDRCVIGGNVWLTHSVGAGETVLAARGTGNEV